MIRIEIIQRPLAASIDGIRLDLFEVGQQYVVGSRIAELLLAEGWAVPVPLDDSVAHVPFSEDDPYESRVVSKERTLVRDQSPPAPSPVATAANSQRKRKRRSVPDDRRPDRRR